jgi:hypothetical protein
MTCRHSSILGPRAIRAISTGIQSFHLVDIQSPVAIQELPIDTKYLDNLALLDRGMYSGLAGIL